MTHDDLADRIDEGHAKLTDAMDVLRKELVGMVRDLEQRMMRGFSGVDLRSGKLEEVQAEHTKRLAAHDARLDTGGILLREFREFRADYNAHARAGARLFKDRDE